MKHYLGEHLLPGHMGNLMILFSLLAAAIATMAFFISLRNFDKRIKALWLILGRACYISSALLVLGSFLILLYCSYHHYFEYYYVWQHSSLGLEAKYLLASLWEGQEGSFMLWSCWQGILGLMLMHRAREWEAPVMTVVSFSLFCLLLMISRIGFFDVKIGSNPFVLLRNTADAPIFRQPDYLQLIKDGNDLNPLLQNYWMVIHPPILFLGFASGVIPFAYAIAGLWKHSFTDWIRPALPYALFSAGILGLGIILGAMWAYESLTFGGYWSWDPVENAVLVPWLILTAGIHAMVIAQKVGNALRSGFFLVLLSYLLILYSTFLTRSGILGDSSVHAFTNSGMNLQLVLFLMVFLLPSIFLFLYRLREIPDPKHSLSIFSREFWMILGSLILFISAFSILTMTSIPVLNLGLKSLASLGNLDIKPLAIGEHPQFQYNKTQIWVAIIVGIMTGFIHYLKYKHTSGKAFFKNLLYPASVTILLSTFFLSMLNIQFRQHGLFYLLLIYIGVVSCIFSVVANVFYIWTGFNGKLTKSGPAIAHMGFSLMLAGILISSSKKEILSLNSKGKQMASLAQLEENPGENLTLFKNVPVEMQNYSVTYLNDSVSPLKPLWYFRLSFINRIDKDSFLLEPNAFINHKNREGLQSNPSARHFWNHDVFAYVTSVPAPADNPDANTWKIKLKRNGDTVSFQGKSFYLKRLITRTQLQVAGIHPQDTLYMASLQINPGNSSDLYANPILIRRDNVSYFLPDTLKQAGLVLQLRNSDERSVEFDIKNLDSRNSYLTLKVYSFPYINFVWIGTFLTVFGFLLSMRRRLLL